MTWQEELRQLDSALAGGELSANDYRKRRDEILAAASSAQPPSAVIGPPTGPQPVVAADDSDTGDNAEVTQIVNVESSGGGEADKTQIIDASTAAGAAASVENGNPERTQVMTAGPQQPMAPIQPQPQHGQQQPQGWSTQLPDPAAPTGVFPRAPQPMQGPAVTPMDAQDLFTSNRSASSGKKPWLIAVVVLVVVALAGGAVWFFGIRDSGTETAQEPEKTTEAPPPPVDITNIELPGEPVKNTGEMDLAKAGELQVIAAAEAALMADAGVDSLVYNGSVDGDYHYLLYAYKRADQKAADELTGKLLDIQKQLGYQDTKVDEVPSSVGVMSVTNESAGGMRGVYTYGDTTLQLFVLQIPAGNTDDMRVAFQRGMTAVTDAAPPAK
jgi:hypothetical protein